MSAFSNTIWSSVFHGQRHSIFIICTEGARKFLLLVKLTVKPYIHILAHASYEVLFLLKRTAQSRGTDFQNIAVVNKILFVQPVA